MSLTGKIPYFQCDIPLPNFPEMKSYRRYDVFTPLARADDVHEGRLARSLYSVSVSICFQRHRSTYLESDDGDLSRLREEKSAKRKEVSNGGCTTLLLAHPLNHCMRELKKLTMNQFTRAAGYRVV